MFKNVRLKIIVECRVAFNPHFLQSYLNFLIAMLQQLLLWLWFPFGLLGSIEKQWIRSPNQTSKGWVTSCFHCEIWTEIALLWKGEWENWLSPPENKTQLGNTVRMFTAGFSKMEGFLAIDQKPPPANVYLSQLHHRRHKNWADQPALLDNIADKLHLQISTDYEALDEHFICKPFRLQSLDWCCCGWRS